MGFYQEIRLTYGLQATKQLKQWFNANVKLANLFNRRIFLLRCRKELISPRHITDVTKKLYNLLITNNRWFLNRAEVFIKALERRIISLEIEITCNSIKKLNNIIERLKTQTIKMIPMHIYNVYCKKLDVAFNKAFLKVKNTNIRKFNNLKRDNSGGDSLFINNSSWLKNISSIDFPKDISDFLSLGPKFGVPVVGTDIRVDRLLAEFENIIDEVPEDKRDELRAKATNIVTNHLNKARNQKPSMLNLMFEKTKSFLKLHPEIVVLQADKGGCTVIMNKIDYINKTYDLLKDTSTYTQLSRDPTTNIQRCYNDLIKTLKNKKEIPVQEAKKLLIYNSTLPKLYCLPKIHKPDIPLRPIVSSSNSSTYLLSKYLADVLKHSLGDITDFNIPDTFSFVNLIQGMVLPNHHVLVSLDVVSLFTNIPLNLVLTIIEDKWPLIAEKTSISRTSFLMLIRFIFNNSCFVFNRIFYKQVFGTPMGSPISPIFATIVLDDVLNNVIPKLPFVFPFIYKYVDDIICAIPEQYIQSTLDTFNSYNEHIQFTIERENNNSVPFLDTRVIRTLHNSIELDWYQKPTSSNRFINYFSNHPYNQKLNLVTAMRNRISHISSPAYVHNNLLRLMRIFLNNGYPKYILRSLIFDTSFFDGPIDDGNQHQLIFKRLPYIQQLTNQVVTLFKPYTQIKIAKYNVLSNRDLFTRLKDKSPKLLTSNLIYKVPCFECNSCYIGQTSQWLCQRLTQHKSDCRLSRNRCALAEHYQGTGHTFNFDSVEILAYESNYKNRLFLEMFHINKCKDSINYKTDTNKLSAIYCNLLNHHN